MQPEPGSSVSKLLVLLFVLLKVVLGSPFNMSQ